MHLVRTKNSYHPYILVAYYLNCLPEDILTVIPRSTRFDWQHRDINNSFGYDWFKENESLFETLQIVAQNRKLLSINKVLLRVIAIKRFIDANMAGIRAGSIESKKVVFNSIRKVAGVIGVKQTLRYLNISFPYYAKLKRKASCGISTLSLCRIKHPAQLLQTEIHMIKKYCLNPDYQFWPISSVYHQMRKDCASHMNLSTFYKYVSLLNLKRSQAINRRKNHVVGIRATAPFQILHADITEFKTKDQQKAFIYLIQDNFSRAILAYRVARERSARYVREILAEVKVKYLLPSGINQCTLLTDDGSENHGEAKQWIVQNDFPKINHLIAQVDVHFSNSMIEAANKQLKYRSLYHKDIEHFEHVEGSVGNGVIDFNNRPHHVLDGLSPLEILKGKRFDKITFKKLTEVAKQNRIQKNQKEKCCENVQL